MQTETAFRKQMQETYRESLGFPVRDELVGHLLPFWLGIRHSQDGASVGLVDADGHVHESAVRSLIYTARMLWTYAEIARTGLSEEAMTAARAEYNLLETMFRDEEEGGYYHAVMPDGRVTDSSKLVYAQGFVLYALAAWYRTSGEKEVLSRAKELLATLQVRCRIYYDEVPAYGENFSRNFELRQDNPLSTHGDPATVTMNTVLHLIEAYTALFQAWPTPHVREALVELLYFYKLFIYNEERRQLNVFLDSKLEPSSTVWSYGHDIEAAWLVEFAVDVLDSSGDAQEDETELFAEIRAISRVLEDAVLAEAIEEVLLEDGETVQVHINELTDGVKDRTRVWWVQAEALAALINAGVKREDEAYFKQALALWHGIEHLFVDKRPFGEWHESLTPDNKAEHLPIAHPWKAFYHNGRACLNVLRFFDLAEERFPL